MNTYYVIKNKEGKYLAYFDDTYRFGFTDKLIHAMFYEKCDLDAIKYALKTITDCEEVVEITIIEGGWEPCIDYWEYHDKQTKNEYIKELEQQLAEKDKEIEKLKEESSRLRELLNFKGCPAGIDIKEMWADLFLETLKEKRELENSLESSFDNTKWAILQELGTIGWYNGYAENIKSILDYIKENDNLETVVPYPEFLKTLDFDNYLNILWQLTVLLYGDYGTSPRAGWLLKENKEKIVEMWEYLYSTSSNSEEE